MATSLPPRTQRPASRRFVVHPLSTLCQPVHLSPSLSRRPFYQAFAAAPSSVRHANASPPRGGKATRWPLACTDCAISGNCEVIRGCGHSRLPLLLPAETRDRERERERERGREGETEKHRERSEERTGRFEVSPSEDTHAICFRVIDWGPLAFYDSGIWNACRFDFGQASKGFWTTRLASHCSR